MALTLQRTSFYPGLLIAGMVVWGLSVVLLATTLFAGRTRYRGWVVRACKEFAALGAVLLVVATVATNAGVWALVCYISPPLTDNSRDGRVGAILAVQWGAAAAMAVYAWLVFAVTHVEEEEAVGPIRLEG